MTKITLKTLGRKLNNKRGERGVREVAKEIGISPATLSRVERGHLPDIETFSKVCSWLGVDPGEILGMKTKEKTNPKIAVHFRKDKVLEPETAESLAQMILLAQRALMVSEELEGIE